jgi:hypothetical protein
MSTIVRSEVVETGFGFYTDDDIKDLSVRQIVSSISEDLLGNKLEGYVNYTFNTDREFPFNARFMIVVL